MSGDEVLNEPRLTPNGKTPAARDSAVNTETKLEESGLGTVSLHGKTVRTAPCTA